MPEMLIIEGPAEDLDLPRDHFEEELNPVAGELRGLRALVLGGTGLIGSHIVASLLERGCSVRILSRAGQAKRAPALDGLSPLEMLAGSLEDAASLRAALDGMDLLFHAAGPYPTRHLGMGRMIRRAVTEMETLLDICRDLAPSELLGNRVPHSRRVAIEQAEMAVHVARVQPERREEIRASVRDPELLKLAEEGRLNASQHPSLEECRRLPGLKRVVYTSSVTTIGLPRGTEPGSPRRRLATEADRYDLAPHPSPYFECKHLLEAVVARSANEGLPAVIVNPTLVVGARDAHLTTGRLLIPVARGKMPFYLRGRIDAVAARDVGEAHVLAALRGRTGQRYIVGGESHSLRGFLGMVAEEAGRRPPFLPVPTFAAEPVALLSEWLALRGKKEWPLFPMHGLRMLRNTPETDDSLARVELGVPRSSLREAVRSALEWYRKERLL